MSIFQRFEAAGRDGGWSDFGLPRPAQLALATFGILALELAVIRWASGQIRILAYFNNLILIAAFLGMGLGVALGKRHPGWVHGALPVLAPLALLLGFAPELGLTQLSFADASISLWGAEEPPALLRFAISVLALTALFWMIVAVFLMAGTPVGHLFGQLSTLRAYSFDLLGSILGVAAIAGVTALGTGPHIWLGLGCVPFVILSRRLPTILAAMLVLAAGAWSVSGAIYSPYNRIDLARGQQLEDGGTVLMVNRDFHQYMHDLGAASLAGDPDRDDALKVRRAVKHVYDIPFVLGFQRQRALIVAAGTGNDVQAALRNGFEQVTSVDIDGEIIDIGRRLHPEQPYSDERTLAVVQDARAFFEQYRGPRFDVVCYGLLDSHAMFSAMSTLRLENFVYTEEGIRSAWELVEGDGILTIAFSVFAGPWIADRLYWTIADATGIEPVAIDNEMHHGRTFVVSRNLAALDFAALGELSTVQPSSRRDQVRRTSDDWPFLYVRPGEFPAGYVTMLALVLATGLAATRRVFLANASEQRFDWPLFFMGAAFLLLETRGITMLSLLFGSTWIVNASVFFGILVMVLLANLLVERLQPRDPRPWFGLLFAAMVAVILADHGALNHYSLLVRGLLGGLLVGLPIAFAGVLVSMMLARSRDAAASLGSNLIGALVGGCLEYLSMWTGLRAMAVVALLLYGLALAAVLRSGSKSESGFQSGSGPRKLPAEL